VIPKGFYTLVIQISESFTFGGLATKTTPSAIVTSQNPRFVRTISLAFSDCAAQRFAHLEPILSQ